MNGAQRYLSIPSRSVLCLQLLSNSESVTSDTVEATDRFGSVLTLRLVRRSPTVGQERLPATSTTATTTLSRERTTTLPSQSSVSSHANLGPALARAVSSAIGHGASTTPGTLADPGVQMLGHGYDCQPGQDRVSPVPGEGFTCASSFRVHRSTSSFAKFVYFPSVRVQTLSATGMSLNGCVDLLINSEHRCSRCTHNCFDG